MLYFGLRNMTTFEIERWYKLSVDENGVVDVSELPRYLREAWTSIGKRTSSAKTFYPKDGHDFLRALRESPGYHGISDTDPAIEPVMA